VEKAKKVGKSWKELKGVFAKCRLRGCRPLFRHDGGPNGRSQVAQCAWPEHRSRWRRNRLAVRLRFRETAVEAISHLFKGPTGIATARIPIAASKVVVAYAKDKRETRDPGRFGRSDDARRGGGEGPREPAVAR